MVIGEAPGRVEDAKDMPFVGRSGSLLDRALALACKSPRQTIRSKVWVTNAAKCRPPANRTPTNDEIDTCVDLYLTKEIERIDPGVILACGNPALYALFQVSGVTAHRGVWIPLPGREERTQVMVTYHPAFVGYRGETSEVGVQFFGDVMEFGARAREASPWV